MSVKYAYGYIRVSTHDQEEISPDSQEHLLRDYAAKNNIVILKIFTDLGISGRKADKRPGFQEMIGLAKGPDHPVDCILVWKFSRFARNQEESIVYKSLLKKQHNVDVISISEPLADGPFGSLIERIIEWMDEYYSIRLSGEVFRGMKENATRGAYQARPPLGYKVIERGKPPVIVPEENTNIITAVEVYDGKIDHIRLCELPEYTKKYYDEFILSNIKKGSILKRACGLYTVNSQIDGYITKFRGIESYNAIYARMVYEHFQTVTHEKPNEPSHYIENYCNYINAFTDSISFDELFDNMLNCKPRKNPRKAIIKQIRLTNGRMGK